MIYAIYGLVFGFFIPYMARRFAKFMPATPGYALYRLIWPVKRVSCRKRRNNILYGKLMRRYLMRSVGWAIVSSAVSYCAFAVFNGINTGWYLALIWPLLLMYEIDERMLILPDMLTVPLLITGFLFMAMQGCESWSYPASPSVLSGLGAAAGYILPVIASLFLVKKYPLAFGGGDIKLMAACGAWIGIGSVPYLILISSAVFAIFSIIRRQRAGAFGPAIVIATLTLVFFNI